MSIFERWLKKKQPPQQQEVQKPMEPERPKTIMDMGWDVVYAMESDEAKRKELYNSLEHQERLLLDRGSLFVSERELDYFLKVMQELKARPVIVFDFKNIQNPFGDLLKMTKEYKDKPKAPVVFVKNYFQEVADDLDSNSNFDGNNFMGLRPC